MPELPEVEHFRRLLLPLCSTNQVLTLTLLGQNHNKKFLSQQDVDRLNQEKLYCQSIERKGKLICMVLSSNDDKNITRYLYVHMGMTGRITTPDRVPCFGHVDSKLEAPEEYPPRFSYLQFTTTSGKKSACFSDPRKFGYIMLVDNTKELESLAPDGLKEDLPVTAWCDYSTGIKSVMLDQKKVVAGIGNWVADEVLYQAEIHPQQSYLTVDESKLINQTLKKVLETAVASSDTSSPYPTDWLFHVRWGKGKNGSKDYHGRTIKFIDAAGRTSAIVPVIQVLSKQGRGPHKENKKKDANRKTIATTKKEKKAPEETKSATGKRKGKKATASGTQKRVKKEEEAPKKGTRRSTRLTKS